MIGNLSVWAGMLVVAMVLLLQRAHATFAQSRFLWYGISLSDVKLLAMWKQETFHPLYYIWESSWSQEALLPMLGLIVALVLAIQSRYCRPLRFLAIIHLAACLILVFTLPNTQFRYIHHMVPLLILLVSAAIMCLTCGLARVARQGGMPGSWQAYAWGMRALAAVVLVALGSGMTLQPRDSGPVSGRGDDPGTVQVPQHGRSGRIRARPHAPG